MTPDEVRTRLDITQTGEAYRVKARESSDLEFKLRLDLQCFKNSIKTIAAFANQAGGCVVFGVRDRPRELVGIGNQSLEEGVQSEQLVQGLSPIPETSFFDVDIHGYRLGVLQVFPLRKGPCIAIKDIAGGEGNANLLNKGVVYARRRGQTAPITGEEFSQILITRDERIRKEIFSFLSFGRDVGFDRAVVVDPRKNGENEVGMTYYLPQEAAKSLNVIDRARIVEKEGAPAYEILGNVQLTVPSENDPRVPMRAVSSANIMRSEIQRIFWEGFPWSHSHLKKAADHLGFWANVNGDHRHTGREALTRTKLYYEAGRQAILQFARQNPDEFVDVVASAPTREMYFNRNDDAE